MERTTHRLHRSEPRGPRDDIERIVAVFEASLRLLDPNLLEEARGAGTDLREEETGEVTRAHPNRCGEGRRDVIACGVRSHEADRLHDRATLCRQGSPGGCELRLACCPSMDHDKLARCERREVRAVVGLHECEGEVDAGGDSSGGCD